MYLVPLFKDDVEGKKSLPLRTFQPIPRGSPVSLFKHEQFDVAVLFEGALLTDKRTSYQEMAMV